MARAKQAPAAATAEIDETLVRQDLNALVAINDMQAAYGEERDLMNQLLGQAQMAGAFEEFSRTVRTSKLAFVKENRLYRALSGKKSPHGAEILTGTWEEFCNLLGRSVDQVDRDISNLRAFGEEALESMSRMGIGYRELRQYRRLPEDQKTALIEAAKSGDKDSFLDLAEELISRHTKEKEELQQQLEAKEAVIVQKNDKITALVNDKNRCDGMTDAERNEELEGRLNKETLLAAGGLLPLRQVIHDIRSLERCPQGMYVAMQGALDRVIAEAMSIATDYGIHLNLHTWPDADELGDPNAGEVFTNPAGA